MSVRPPTPRAEDTRAHPDAARRVHGIKITKREKKKKEKDLAVGDDDGTRRAGRVRTSRLSITAARVLIMKNQLQYLYRGRTPPPPPPPPPLLPPQVGCVCTI